MRGFQLIQDDTQIAGDNLVSDSSIDFDAPTLSGIEAHIEITEAQTCEMCAHTELCLLHTDHE